MEKAQVPEFSKETIVTSIGVTVVQGLDFLANELNLSARDTQQLWSPFLAAAQRLNILRWTLKLERSCSFS
jgi:hypothetical protein